MKIFSFLSISFVLFLFTSCTQEETEVSPQGNQSVTDTQFTLKDGSKDSLAIDTTLVKDLANEAIVNFVTEVKKIYTSGMTYEDFKDTLDPDDGLENMRPEGEALVRQAFDYIVNDVSDSSMEGDKMMQAIASITDYASKEGVVYAADVDFEKGSQWLFGLSETSQVVLAKDPCKWYQIGCHINKLWKWMSTTASGGGASNGETLASVVGILAAIIGLLLL